MKHTPRAATPLLSALATIWLSGVSAVSVLGQANAQTPDTASLKVEVQDLTVDFGIFFAPVLPGEVLNVQVLGRPDATDISFNVPDRGKAITGETRLSWKAPTEPGHYPITISDGTSGETFTLNVFVMHPFSAIEDGKLNGYRIGQYPDKPLRGLDAYKKPLGFIAVNDETKDVQISPHFTLGQFICKQTTNVSERYVVLRPELLKKLETAVDLLEDDGFSPDTLFIMSGYRTPFYNKAIGNVQYSRHVYGDAADVYLDVAPRDGDMDDLNQDGQVTKADASYLYDMIASFDSQNTGLAIQGGIGSYNRNAAHGPFVHIDTRGTPARWGR